MPPRPLVILDANELTRHGLEAILREQPTWQTAGTFAVLEDCITYLRSHAADLLVLDDSALMMEAALQMVRKLKAQFSHLKILIVSRYTSAPYIEALITCGVSGFVHLDEDRLRTKLLRAMEAVSDGDTYLSPVVARSAYQKRHRSPQLDRLTPRDMEVIRLMSLGKTPSECAMLIGISGEAIYRIRSKLRRVLNVRTSEQIVQAALKAGLLDEGINSAPDA